METQIIKDMLSFIGAHGVFAFIGTLFFVRMVRVTFYMEKPALFLANIIIASIMGCLCVYFYVPDATLKMIIGGAFTTIISSMAGYELLKFMLAAAYEKTESQAVAAFYFFLTPAPIKIKKNGERIKVPPHATLTQVFDKARLDKPAAPTPDEHEEGTVVLYPDGPPETLDTEDTTDRRDK